MEYFNEPNFCEQEISRYKIEYIQSKIELFDSYYDEFILYLKLFPQYDKYIKNIYHISEKVKSIDKENVLYYNFNNKKISYYLRKVDQFVFTVHPLFQKNTSSYQDELFNLSQKYSAIKQKNHSEFMTNIANANKMSYILCETIEIKRSDVFLDDFMEDNSSNDSYSEFMEDFKKVNLPSDKSDTDESFVMV